MEICGGGVRYSEQVRRFKNSAGIPYPIGENQAEKSDVTPVLPIVGRLGVTVILQPYHCRKGRLVKASNQIVRLHKASKSLFLNPNVKFVSINISRFQAYKAIL